jgi:hypothetical protein
LFNGANWIAVEPVPASAGNWMFADNLFDGIDFQADSAAPLDFDFNGYYPLPASQELYNAMAYQLSLTAGDSTTLVSATNDLGGLHEVSLGSAPPYARGVFGSYYLTTVTPLWEAGSRTASDAGLTQYTTFTNQAKDTASQPVNIGLHYVAATNALPLDSDGDGVPDYLESEYGTDPNVAMTDGETPDALNAAYDDVDLSGSGLVGRIKKALGIAPFNPNNPLTLTQVGWDEEWGIATFELPVSYSVLTNIGSVNLFLDGVCATLQDVSQATDGNTLITWNSAFNSSRAHLLQARLAVNLSAGDTAILTALGNALPYSSDNPVRFYESDAVYDDSGAYLDATITSSTNTYYTIQIFDPSTSPASFIKGITNSTSNGMIQEDWNLTYDDGVTTFTNDTFDAVFTVSDTDPSAASLAATRYAPHDAHPNKPSRTKRHTKLGTTEQGNGFAFMYTYTPSNGSMSEDYSDEVGAVRVGMQNIVDTLCMPVAVGLGGHDNHYDSSFNRYASQNWPQDPGDPGYITSQSTIQNKLLPSMSDGATKNFYAHAHGTGNSIADYSLNVMLFNADLTGALGNYQLGAKMTKINYPCRFVFLDGCSTASTYEWPHAFGIFSYWDTGSPARGKIGNQAYLGWAKEHTGWLNPQDNSTVSENVAFAYTEALADMYEAWMDGSALYQCVDYVSTPKKNIAPLLVDDLKGKPIHIWGDNGIDGYPFDYTIPANKLTTSKIYVIGHSGLTRSGLNGQFDNLPKYKSPQDTP